MKYKLSPEFLQRLKDAVSMVQVVGEHVVLRKMGSSYMGLCPFHSERSPSFNVNEDKKVYYCHGCQAGGDLLRFLMDVHGISFLEAVKELSERARIQIPPEVRQQLKLSEGESGGANDPKTIAYRLNRFAAAYFKKQMEATPSALEYIRARGVTQELEQNFYVGFAPPGWEGLSQYLEKAKAPMPLAHQLGLVNPSKQGNWIDFFRDRVMFPILDLKGKIAGFGGRTLSPDDSRKYLNSQESLLYQKNKLVFGLYQARKFARERDTLILVEGYFDVLAMHRHGFENTVAVCGTKMSGEHLRIFKRFADKIIIFYDGDRAGQEAMDAAMKTGLELGVVVYGAFLPGGMDPDEFLSQKLPPEELQKQMTQILDEAKPLLDLRIDEAIAESRQGPDAKTHAIKKIGVWLSLFTDPVGRSVRSDSVAQTLSLSKNWMSELLGGAALPRTGSVPLGPQKPKAIKRPPVPYLPSEKVVLISLTRWPESAPVWERFVKELPPGWGPSELVATAAARELTDYVFFTMGKATDSSSSNLPSDWVKVPVSQRLNEYLLQVPDSPMHSLVAKAEVVGLGRFRPEELELAFASLLLKAWARFSQQIQQKAAQAESHKDAVLQANFLKEYLDVQRKIKELYSLYDKNDRSDAQPEN